MSEKEVITAEANSENPTTAIVIGSGCSCNIGIPTMNDFMDRVFDDLSSGAATDLNCSKYLKIIQDFIKEIKSSSAYVANQILNIEELYGLAEMDSELRGNSIGDGNTSVKHALNFAIYRLAYRAGEEFVSEGAEETWGKLLNQMPAIKRESLAENYYHKDLGRKSANLLAYLSLATYRDNYGKYPVFVQFNWDLALDRALCLAKNKNLISDPIGDSDEEYFPWMRLFFSDDGKEVCSVKDDYSKCPRIIRPHGGIAWISCGDIKRDVFKAIGSTDRLSFLGDGFVFNKDFLESPDKSELDGKVDKYSDPIQIGIIPPTWRKHLTSDAFKNQWRILTKSIANVRRIIFIGYSLPKTDVYLRHYFSLALINNNFVPKVYVWNPDIFKPSSVNESYTELFAPLAREGRLFGIDKYFGDPGLLDLNRAIREAKPLKPFKN